MLRLTDVGRKTEGEGLGGPGGYIDNAVLGRVGVVVLGFYEFRRPCTHRHEASAGRANPICT